MKTVFFDIDTQLDFVFPAGALYVPRAELKLPSIAALNRYAASQGYPIISTVDAHGEDDPEFRIWRPHCVAGTTGQQKPQSTLVEKPFVVSTRENAPLPDASVKQVIVEKQVLDCFSNPNLQRLVEQYNADRYVVYGVVTEHCVRCAAMGLLRTGKRVELVTDAIETLHPEESDRTLREFEQASGVLTTVSHYLA